MRGGVNRSSSKEERSYCETTVWFKQRGDMCAGNPVRRARKDTLMKGEDK